MKVEKGIILAGGTGTRLYPLTASANKQLLPIYDKPVIYYSLTILMLAGITDILIISTPHDLTPLKNLLGDGAHLGMKFIYQIQEEPRGLPDAFILGENFIDKNPVAMILGDNFFHGHGLSEDVFNPAQNLNGAHIFTYNVEDPHRYGVIELDEDGKIVSLEEKPEDPKSTFAVTGLYYFDGTVSARAKSLSPSSRNELEIIDLVKSYLVDDILSFSQLGRGYVWLDTGTPKSLLDAANYVEVIQTRQGIVIASPEEVAWRMGFIDSNIIKKNLEMMPKCKYRKYLERLLMP